MKEKMRKMEIYFLAEKKLQFLATFRNELTWFAPCSLHAERQSLALV